jgi:hypothetical protein
MKELIQKLRDEHLKVTIHDIGIDTAVFALAVVIEEPIDIWYVAHVMSPEVIPRIVGKLLVFPELIIDVRTYDFIIEYRAQDQSTA